MSASEPVPLAFSPPLHRSASLAGVISVAARINVLGDVKPILRAAGFEVTRPGAISMRVAGREGTLATRLGCAVEDLEALATPLVPSIGGERLIRWGDGCLHRADVDMRRRRISPASLLSDPHHRATWMNRLLDYCPESLERLVDECSACGRPLGWLSGWGLDHCDDRRCREIPPSSDVLSPEIAEGYRRFAAFVSPVVGERACAVSALHADLRTLSPSTLADLAMRLGMVVGGSDPVARHALRLLPSTKKARAAADGATLLFDWPLRFRSAIDHVLASQEDCDGRTRRRLRASLLLASGTARGPATTHSILSAAVPEAFREVGLALVGDVENRVQGSEAARRLGASHTDLHRVAATGALSRVVTLASRYNRGLYDAEDIAAASFAWRGSAQLSLIERELGIPRYAAERLVACGDVPRETASYVLAKTDRTRVPRSAVESYLRSIHDVARVEDGPEHGISLVAAMRAVGGRLKPWRQVLSAVVSGDLPVHLRTGSGALAHRLIVMPEEIAPFRRLDVDDGVPPSYGGSMVMSQMDAMTVLNMHQKNAPAIRQAGLLTFERRGTADVATVQEVLAVATEYMPVAEAVARSGESLSSCRKLLRSELGDAVSPLGWHRSAAEKLFPL